MEPKEFRAYLVGGGLDVSLHVERGELQEGMTIEEELVSYAEHRGFSVLGGDRYWPPVLDPFVPVRRVIVEMVVERDGKRLHFGNDLCVHPSIPAEAIDENVALRYALVQPVKRQMWDYVSDGNGRGGEHDGD